MSLYQMQSSRGLLRFQLLREKTYCPQLAFPHQHQEKAQQLQQLAHNFFCNDDAARKKKNISVSASSFALFLHSDHPTNPSVRGREGGTEGKCEANTSSSSSSSSSSVSERPPHVHRIPSSTPTVHTHTPAEECLYDGRAPSASAHHVRST